jgi:hypothetical protein
MKDPTPVRHDPGAAKRKDTHEVRRGAATAEQPCPVVVRYHCRMRLQRVFPLIVEVKRGDRQPESGAGSLPAIVRPVIPGALVVPAEEKIDASVPGSQVVFHVTPLARRRLPEARVEVHQKHRQVQPIPLNIKVTTQRLACLLLALAVLVPWGLSELARHPLQGDVYDFPSPAVGKEQRAPPAPKGGVPRPKEVVGLEERPAPENIVAGLLVLVQPGMPKGGPMGGGMPQGGFPGGPPPDASASTTPRARAGSPDEVLRDRLRAWVHANFPQNSSVTDWIASTAYGQEFHQDQQRPGGAEEGRREVVYNDFASWLSWLYRWILSLTEGGIHLYVGLVLLALAVVAWVVHRTAWSYERRVLVFAASGDAGAEPTLRGD